MLLTFPQLLTWSFFVPTLLRLALGFFLISSAILRFSKNNKEFVLRRMKESRPECSSFCAWHLGAIEVLLSIMLIVGVLTQVAATITAIYSVYLIILKDIQTLSVLATDKRSVYVLLFAMSVSILLLGPGALSFDFPL